jgi:hypothetical protein
VLSTYLNDSGKFGTETDRARCDGCGDSYLRDGGTWTMLDSGRTVPPRWRPMDEVLSEVMFWAIIWAKKPLFGTPFRVKGIPLPFVNVEFHAGFCSDACEDTARRAAAFRLAVINAPGKQA